MLTLYVPSRGRPEAAQEILDSFNRTRTTEDVECVFLVDHDDPTMEEYPHPIQIGQPTGDPTGPLNVAVKTSKSDIVGFAGDDSRFLTIGWDIKVLDAMKQPSFCWGEDGHDVPWPSTVFITRAICDALGYMVPPTLRRGYFDVAWLNLARLTRTEKVVDAMFLHDNSAGDPKSPNFKPSHQVPPHVIASDQSAFEHWQANEMKRDAQKIRHTIYA